MSKTKKSGGPELPECDRVPRTDDIIDVVDGVPVRADTKMQGVIKLLLDLLPKELHDGHAAQLRTLLEQLYERQDAVAEELNAWRNLGHVIGANSPNTRANPALAAEIVQTWRKVGLK